MNSESEDDSRVVSEKVGDYDSSDTDSLELEPRVSGPGGNTEPAGDSLTSNLTSLIGSFISSNTAAAQQRRPSNLSEDFEFISQEGLNDENI